jgi:hypothetical protein
MEAWLGSNASLEAPLLEFAERAPRDPMHLQAK